MVQVSGLYQTVLRPAPITIFMRRECEKGSLFLAIFSGGVGCGCVDTASHSKRFTSKSSWPCL